MKKAVIEKSKELHEAQEPLKQLRSARSSLKAEEKDKTGKLAPTVMTRDFGCLVHLLLYSPSLA